MKTIKMIVAILAMMALSVGCETSDVAEEESLFEETESVDLTKIKKRT